jgi:alkanesulfonate monooxygenase SsuD/methylene tetrahydromethanopterin reductase-like flavin-dependent oxidoreductase (luciferase family)
MTHTMRFGILRNFAIPFDEIVEHVLAFEAAGFDSVWGIDHITRPTDPEAPLFEAWTGLAALAALTSRIRLGIMVSSNTFRHPALLAKEATTVDHVSRGRLEIGIGAGGFEAEHRTFDIPYPPPGERVDRLAEAVTIIDLLLRNDVTSYEGRFWTIDNGPCRPQPVQTPRPPITIAGAGPRIVRLAARLADRWNAYGTPEETAANVRLIAEQCAAIGRGPGEIIISVYLRSASLGLDPWESEAAFRDIVARYLAAGATEIIFDAPAEGQMGDMRNVAATTLPSLRQMERG